MYEEYLVTIWVSQKFGYIIKLVTFIYIPGILMFLGFTNTKISKKHKLFSLSNLHSSNILPTSPFFGEKCTLPHFLKNKQNSNSHPFCKVGEIQLWLIKTTYFTYLLLILIQQYKNTSGDSTGGYMLQKNRIGR